YLDHRLRIGVGADVLALDVDEGVLVERLHRLVDHQRAIDLLERLDDALRAVLAGGGINVRGPTVFRLRLTDVAGDLDVALEHAVIRVGDAQKPHRRAARADLASDVVDLFAQPILGEVVHFGVPAHTLDTEGAGERTSAVGL